MTYASITFIKLYDCKRNLSRGS